MQPLLFQIPVFWLYLIVIIFSVYEKRGIRGFGTVNMSEIMFLGTGCSAHVNIINYILRWTTLHQQIVKS